MSHLRKVIGVFLGATLFFYTTQLLAQAQQKTDKIKITSYYKIDSDWTFNLFDYANNKAIRLFNNEENAGYKIIVFDETTQTATLSSPQGIFLISVQSSNTNKTSNQALKKPSEELDFSILDSNKLTQKRILDNIK